MELGRASFEWARSHMPVFRLAEKYLRTQMVSRKNLFQGLRLAACLHVSKETAVLIRSLHSFGLEISLVAANPLSSQDDIVAFLKNEGILVAARSDESTNEYVDHIRSAARSKPDLIIDDGGELHVAYAATSSATCIGGTDETTSGTLRLKALDEKRKLRYPTIPVNDARTKHIFDNKYGTGQSAIDGLIRSTGLLIAGKTTVIAGYGWVGRGVAERARGMGANVVITEVDPLKALEAKLDGFQVMPMIEAAKVGDVFLTCTGQIRILGSEHFTLMKDGAILGNVGHFNQEIDVSDLYRIGNKIENVRRNITKISLRRQVTVPLCQGRVINLVACRRPSSRESCRFHLPIS